jgi:hypothetical protein
VAWCQESSFLWIPCWLGASYRQSLLSHFISDSHLRLSAGSYESFYQRSCSKACVTGEETDLEECALFKVVVIHGQPRSQVSYLSVWCHCDCHTDVLTGELLGNYRLSVQTIQPGNPSSVTFTPKNNLYSHTGF